MQSHEEAIYQQFVESMDENLEADIMKYVKAIDEVAKKVDNC